MKSIGTGPDTGEAVYVKGNLLFEVLDVDGLAAVAGLMARLVTGFMARLVTGLVVTVTGGRGGVDGAHKEDGGEGSKRETHFDRVGRSYCKDVISRTVLSEGE